MMAKVKATGFHLARHAELVSASRGISDGILKRVQDDGGRNVQLTTTSN